MFEYIISYILVLLLGFYLATQNNDIAIGYMWGVIMLSVCLFAAKGGKATAERKDKNE